MADDKPTGHDHSVTAATKTIVEIVRVLDIMARNWAVDIRFWFDRPGRAKAADIQEELGQLRFDSTGFREILKVIAAGKFSDAQFHSLDSYLFKGSTKIYSLLSELRHHRQFLDQRLGPEFYERLDSDVYVVKNEIRRKIKDLSTSKKPKAEKVALANEILDDIERFNGDLAELRSIISPPTVTAYSQDKTKQSLPVAAPVEQSPPLPAPAKHPSRRRKPTTMK